MRALRKIEPTLKIIISTGRAEDFDTAEITRLQINGSLAKPYTQRNLLVKIASVLAHSSAAAA